MLESSIAVAFEMPPLVEALTERKSLPEPRSTSELSRPLAVAGSFPPPHHHQPLLLLAEALMEIASSPDPASMLESSAPNARISPWPEALALMNSRSLPLPKSIELFSEPHAGS